jgi:large subunit ribosomal protein L3
MKGLIGKKLGMSQIYDDTGKVTPVTVVQAGPCTVIDQMTEERNGGDIS